MKLQWTTAPPTTPGLYLLRTIVNPEPKLIIVKLIKHSDAEQLWGHPALAFDLIIFDEDTAYIDGMQQDVITKDVWRIWIPLLAKDHIYEFAGPLEVDTP